jgi:hypothetical protein
MIEQTEVITNSPKFSHFRVSKRLMRSNRFKYLSVRALRLYLFLNLQFPKRNATDQLLFTDYEIEQWVGIPKDMVSQATADLRHAKLITYRRRKAEKKTYYKVLQDKSNTVTTKESSNGAE